MPDQDELRFEAEGTFRSGNPDRAVDANGNGTIDGVFGLAPPGSTTCGFTNPATGQRVTTVWIRLPFTQFIGGTYELPQVLSKARILWRYLV